MLAVLDCQLFNRHFVYTAGWSTLMLKLNYILFLLFIWEQFGLNCVTLFHNLSTRSPRQSGHLLYSARAFLSAIDRSSQLNGLLWPCVIRYQYNEISVMHFSFNLLRIKGPLHVSSITCSSSVGTVKLQPSHSQLTLYARIIPNAVCE
jgi:hypothetical protein